MRVFTSLGVSTRVPGVTFQLFVQHLTCSLYRMTHCRRDSYNTLSGDHVCLITCQDFREFLKYTILYSDGLRVIDRLL